MIFEDFSKLWQPKEPAQEDTHKVVEPEDNLKEWEKWSDKNKQSSLKAAEAVSQQDVNQPQAEPVQKNSKESAQPQLAEKKMVLNENFYLNPEKLIENGGVVKIIISDGNYNAEVKVERVEGDESLPKYRFKIIRQPLLDYRIEFRGDSLDLIAQNSSRTLLKIELDPSKGILFSTGQVDPISFPHLTIKYPLGSEVINQQPADEIVSQEPKPPKIDEETSQWTTIEPILSKELEDGFTLKFGRTLDKNDFVPKNGNQLVSRYHAQLRFQNGQLFVLDLGSSNGTYINNIKISGNEQIPINGKITEIKLGGQNGCTFAISVEDNRIEIRSKDLKLQGAENLPLPVSPLARPVSAEPYDNAVPLQPDVQPVESSQLQVENNHEAEKALKESIMAATRIDALSEQMDLDDLKKLKTFEERLVLFLIGGDRILAAQVAKLFARQIEINGLPGLMYEGERVEISNDLSKIKYASPSSATSEFADGYEINISGNQITLFGSHLDLASVKVNGNDPSLVSQLGGGRSSVTFDSAPVNKEDVINFGIGKSLRVHHQEGHWEIKNH